MSGAPTTTPADLAGPLQADFAILIGDGHRNSACGVDLVVDAVGNHVHVLVPIALPGPRVSYRLTFDALQLARLMHELCEASELVMTAQGAPACSAR